MSDRVEPSLAIIAVTQAVGAYTTFLPPFTEVRRKSREDAAFKADVRVGEVAAASLTIGIGAMISHLTGSPSPVILSAITAAGMVCLYEYSLSTDPIPTPKGNY